MKLDLTVPSNPASRSDASRGPRPDAATARNGVGTDSPDPRNWATRRRRSCRELPHPRGTVRALPYPLPSGQGVPGTIRQVCGICGIYRFHLRGSSRADSPMIPVPCRITLTRESRSWYEGGPLGGGGEELAGMTRRSNPTRRRTILAAGQDLAATRHGRTRTLWGAPRQRVWAPGPMTRRSARLEAPGATASDFSGGSQTRRRDDGTTINRGTAPITAPRGARRVP